MPLQTIDTGLFGQAETSSTSNDVSVGTKTFTLDVDHNVIDVDYTVQIVSSVEPACWMYGVVTAKSSPDVTVSVFKVSDLDGTFSEWDLQTIAGPFAGLPASQTLAFSSDSFATPSVGDVLNLTVETGKALYDNSTVYVAAVSDRTNFSFCTVVSYNSGTGALKLVVNRVSGSGTQALWAVSLVDVTQSFYTSVGDTNYTILPSDKNISVVTAFTADRTWTLPSASRVPPGYTLTISDLVGAFTSYGLYLAPSIGDTLNGFDWLSPQPVFRNGEHLIIISDGAAKWIFDPLTLGVLESNLSVSGYISATGAVAPFFPFVHDTDHTKKFVFDVSGITTGTTRTLIVPNVNTTVVGTDATQTLINKDLTSGTNTFPTFNQNTTGTAAGLSATLAVNKGGTGATTLTGILKGNGTSAVTAVTAPSGAIVGDTDTQTLSNKTIATGTFTGGVKNSDAHQIGYALGAGGSVTQATSKSTAVTVNTPTGLINLNSAALGAGASVTFTVNNSVVGISDVIVVGVRQASFFPNYRVEAGGIVNATSFQIRVTNISAGSLSDAVGVSFAIIAGTTA